MKTNTGNTTAVITIIIAIILVCAWMFWGKSSSPLDEAPGTVSTSTLTETSKPIAHVNGAALNLEVVDTPDTRELGLSNRDTLAQDAGMLFVFDDPEPYEFWMKDMKFSLDMIWLDPNFKVIYIAKNIAPETYPDTTFKPESDALYVMEVNAGYADKNNLKVGDVVQVSLNK